MRKRIGLFLALLAACTMIWCCAGAESYGPEAFGTGGTLSWSVTDGKMVISGTGMIPGYSSEQPENTPWQKPEHRDLLNTVTAIEVQDGVTYIGDKSFTYLFNVKTITLPDSLTGFGYQAFGYSEAEIALPDEITYARELSYSNILYVNPASTTAKTLGEIYTEFWVPGGAYKVNASPNKITVTEINPEKAAENNGKLVIDEGITHIGLNTYNGSIFSSSNVTEIVFPGTLVSIPKGAFEFYRTLEKVTFSSAVTIAKRAFYNCDDLEITLTGGDVSGMTVEENAFEGCGTLTIHVDPSVTTVPNSLLNDPVAGKGKYDAMMGPVYTQLRNRYGLDVTYLPFVPESISVYSTGAVENMYQGRSAEIGDIYYTPSFSWTGVNPELLPVLVYESSDESVATVNQNGLVYAVAPGEARITVYVKDHPEIKLNTGFGYDEFGNSSPRYYIPVTVKAIPDGEFGAFITGYSSGKVLTVSFGAKNGTPPYTFTLTGSYGGSKLPDSEYTTTASGETVSVNTSVKENQKTEEKKTFNVIAKDAAGATANVTLTYHYGYFGTTTYETDYTQPMRQIRDQYGNIRWGYPEIAHTTYAWEVRISGTDSFPGAIKSISLNRERLVMKPGETETLTALITGGSQSDLAWYSSNPAVVSVDAKGNVTAVKGGSAEITAKSIDSGHMSATCKVYVVETFAESVTVAKGAEDTTAQTLQLTAKVLPDNASVKDVKWTSSDPEFAPIDENGTITWKDNMKAVFTATTVDGSAVTASLELEWTSCPKTITEEYELYQFNDDTWGTLDRNQVYGLIGVDLRLRFYSNGTMGLEIWQDGEHQVVDHITCTEDGLTYHTKDSLFATYFKRIGDGLIETDALYRGTMKLIELGKAPARIDNPTLVSAWKLDRMEQYGTVKYLEELQKTRPTLDEHYRLYNNGLVKMTTVKDGEERTIPYSTTTSAYMINGKTFERFNGELRIRSDYDSIYSYYIPEDHEYTGPGAPLLPGDVNEDGAVDGRDVLRLMKYLAGEEDPETGEQIEINEDSADVDGSGAIDEKDLLRLIRYLGGENVKLLPGAISGNG